MGHPEVWEEVRSRLCNIGLPHMAEFQLGDRLSITPNQAAAAQEAICLADYEPLAKAKMSATAWEYINAAAADELTDCLLYTSLPLAYVGS